MGEGCVFTPPPPPPVAENPSLGFRALQHGGVGSCPAPSDPPPSGDAERWVRAVRWGGGRTPWVCLHRFETAFPGGGTARMRCLESLARVQAASFAAGSGGERRDVRGCGGRGYPELLRAPTAAPHPGTAARSQPQPAAGCVPHTSVPCMVERPAPPSPPPPPHHLQALHKTPLHVLDPHPQPFPRPQQCGGSAALLCMQQHRGGSRPPPPLHPPPPHGSASE